MKEGSDIVYYGNRPEQRNPAAIIERGGIRTNLEDNISINIAPRWEIIPKLIVRGQYSYRISSSAQRDEREAYNFLITILVHFYKHGERVMELPKIVQVITIWVEQPNIHLKSESIACSLLPVIIKN